MGYSVMHITKTVSKSVGGLNAHIDRDVVSENVEIFHVEENLNIHEGELMPQSEYKDKRKEIGSIDDRVNKRIAEGYKGKRKLRDNAVRRLNIIQTGSHEDLISMDSNQLKEWFKDNYRWTCKTFGKENVVNYSLHMDEKTPHIHATVVPLTSDGRLSAKELLNGKDRKAPKGEHLRKMQDSYAEAMSKYGLKRGESAKKTLVKRTTTAEYYQKLNTSKRELKDLKRTTFKDFDKVKEQAIDTLTAGAMKEKNTASMLQKVVKEGLSDVRQNTNLVGLATHFGYKLQKDKSCATSIQMQNNQGEQIVLTPPNSGKDWLYFKRGTKERGTAVDFLVNQGMDWAEIIKHSKHTLQSHRLGEPIIKSLPNQIVDLQASNSHFKRLWEEKTKNKPKIPPLSNYLTADRAIPHKVVKSVSKSIYIASKRASFPCFLPDKQGKWIPCGYMTYSKALDGKSKKSLPKSLPKGWAILSVLPKEGGARKSAPMVFCENPIDGLSYVALEKLEAYTIVSSNGRPSSRQLEALKHLPIDRPKIIACDNDRSGREMAQLFQEKLHNTTLALPPKLKDWNQELKHHRIDLKFGKSKGFGKGGNDKGFGVKF